MIFDGMKSKYLNYILLENPSNAQKKGMATLDNMDIEIKGMGEMRNEWEMRETNATQASVQFV